MPSDRELSSWDRLGRVAAISLVETVARLLNEAPPGGIWGQTLYADIEVLPRVEAACRAHVERILFKHPSFLVTGGACEWAPAGYIQAPSPGYVALRVLVRWPRFEDCPFVRGKGPATGEARGIAFSPDMIPRFDVPRSLAGPEWES